jgi:alpha/beta superfamily hydrolase
MGGVADVSDAVAVCRHILTELYNPPTKLYFAGYSYGSCIAASALQRCPEVSRERSSNRAANGALLSARASVDVSMHRAHTHMPTVLAAQSHTPNCVQESTGRNCCKNLHDWAERH